MVKCVDTENGYAMLSQRLLCEGTVDVVASATQVGHRVVANVSTLPRDMEKQLLGGFRDDASR